jgi:hypothetical protein
VFDGLSSLSGAIGATLEALIAPFCRREKSLSYCWEKGWLVGAVGIENNAKRSFKDLAETVRNAKTLKRNSKELEGILIGPSMAPRFWLKWSRRRITSRGTDGKPTRLFPTTTL